MFVNQESQEEYEISQELEFRKLLTDTQDQLLDLLDDLLCMQSYVEEM